MAVGALNAPLSATDTLAIILLVGKDSLIVDDWLYHNPMTNDINEMNSHTDI